MILSLEKFYKSVQRQRAFAPMKLVVMPGSVDWGNHISAHAKVPYLPAASVLPENTTARVEPEVRNWTERRTGGGSML